jgi:ceramide glucosyltransferase
LASLCAQDYPAFQIVFGVQDPADPALRVIGRVQARFPDVVIDVVIDGARHGRNRKVGNLLNMIGAARHDVLVIADSDIHAPPGYLRSVVAALQQPGVGLVTTVYAGLAGTPSLVGRLGAAYINHNFLTGALVARVLRRQDCLGATMALRRQTLEQIGGFAALADHVADDAVLGQLVRAEGLKVAVAGTVPATTVPETRLPDLVEHELRWMRTSKSIAPLGFALSVAQYPLFWATLMLVVSGFASWAWAGFGMAWLLRGAIASMLDRMLRIAAPLAIWGLPLRDFLSITIFLASYGSDRVVWRGDVHQITRFSKTGLEPGNG